MGIEMAKTTKPASKRAYLKQSDVPSAPLAEALRMPQAIFDHYAGKPATPLQIAKALNVDPKGSQIRVLSGALPDFRAEDFRIVDILRRSYFRLTEIPLQGNERNMFVQKYDAVLT